MTSHFHWLDSSEHGEHGEHPAELPPLLKHEAPPVSFIEWVRKSGRACPDESNPYDASSFHHNFKGYEMGHKDQAARQRYFAKMNANLSRFGSWANLNIHEADADYAMNYGDHALGVPFPFAELKPMLEREKQRMADSYTSALDIARAKETDAFRELTTNPKYKSNLKKSSGSSTKCLQPDDTLEGLYMGSIGAMSEMWDLTEKIAAAGSSTEYCWSIKKLLRTTKKMFEKYDRHPSRVTDVARSSIVLGTLRELTRSFDCALDTGKAIRVKNRFVEPELGYSDVLLNIQCANGFIVEIQLHLAPVFLVKGTAGHGAFKWFRRLLQDDNKYEGERDSAGRRHGQGKFMLANGDLYEGQWFNDKKEGHGTYTDADGHRYEGEFKNDKREGKCSFIYFDGSKYEGSYVNDKKEGFGIFTYADGQKYVGYWKNGKRHGNGTFWYADNSRYEGDWVAHKRQGQGTLFSASGVEHSGTWNDDQLVSSTQLLLGTIGCGYWCWRSTATPMKL
eukprot:gnl/TRDRNA2_/TRDRNA2_85277_c0_seq2.p1 gnl/TRDRNA2_/TRDRNA2_85277_c0~~gnl/TRDRNA2_/TRDRNA2_85277_c0_seq2.p1  ORF type:complete len:506 (+),score=100.69 gnl/TRDRNA2_/TRDRNA2_85277_c0_seq2:120-1637(+)